MSGNLLVFAGIIALASISPGPNTLLLVEQSIRYGAARIAPTILGNLACLMLVALAAATGVGAFLKGAPLTARTLQAAGGLYLAYLGLRALLGLATSRGAAMQASASGPAGAGERFARAFSVSATNPKSILFLAALFPSFVDPRQPVAGQFAGLFAVIAVVVTTVHGSIAVAASAVSRLLGGERFSYLVRLASGCAFMGFGAAVVFTAWRGAG